MKKPKNKMGTCIHIRITTDTENVFKREASEMRIALSTYCRVFIEEMRKRHGLVSLGK